MTAELLFPNPDDAAIVSSESTSLLSKRLNQQPETHSLPCASNTDLDISLKGSSSENGFAFSILPLALLASLGMAATSATTITAYAYLLCEDAAHCKDSERNAYAGAVAVAICVANSCSLLILGLVQRLVKNHPKFGLFIWFLCRAMSVAVLALGVYLHNIHVALFGRIFEGLASDNLLHFNLNTIYASVQNKSDISLLMGSSLALYMVGMSISPVLAGLLADFTTSFIAALVVFALSLVYLGAFIGRDASHRLEWKSDNQDTEGLSSVQEHDNAHTVWSTGTLGFISTIFAPFIVFYDIPLAIPHGLSLLMVNMVQAYLFPAIMVQMSLEFGFGGTQNGRIISIAAATSSLYLFIVLYAGPRLSRSLTWWSPNKREAPNSQSTQRTQWEFRDLFFACLSMAVQASSVTAIGLITQEWQIYPVVAVSALGLAVPSFLKSHFVSFMEDAPAAVAALAIMETVGGLLAPVVLGGWQATHMGPSTFFLAGGILCAALATFLAGEVKRRGRIIKS